MILLFILEMFWVSSRWGCFPKRFRLWHRQASTRLVGKLRFGQAPLLGASISMSKTSSVQPNLTLSDDLVISRSLMLLLAQLGLLIFQLSPAIA